MSENLVRWADLIYVMEYQHKERIKELFPSASNKKEIIVLEIKDVYEYMNPELIEIFKQVLSEYFD